MWSTVVKSELERYNNQLSESKIAADSHRNRSSRSHVCERVDSSASKSRICCQQCDKSSKTFIPFVIERDGLNRLITKQDTEERKRITKSVELIQGYRTKPSAKVSTDQSSRPCSKRSRLGTILDLDQEKSEKKTTMDNSRPFQMPTCVTEEAENAIPMGFNQFRVVRQVVEVPKINLTKSNVMRANSKDSKEIGDTTRGTPRAIKPSASFCVTDRETLEKIRARSVTGGGGHLRQLDGKGMDVLKPRVPKVFISSTKLERNKPLPSSNENMSKRNLVSELQQKYILDFSKQTGREKGNIWPTEEKVVKTINIPKDFRKMDDDFRFAKKIRSQYLMTRPRIPESFKVREKNCPYESLKLKELANNLKRQYNLAQERSSDDITDAK